MAEQKPLGVIDVVSAGLEIVRRRPWTLVVPLVFDLILWLSPRLSLATMLRPIAQQMFDSTGVSPDVAESLAETQQAFMQFVDSLNVVGLVAAAINSVARVPSLLAVDSADVHSPITSLAYTVQLQSPGLVVLLFVPLFLLGLFAAAVYVELIAQGVRPLEATVQGAWLVRVARLWLNLIGLALILGAFTLLAGVLLMVGQAVSEGAEFGSFIAALVAVGLFWLYIYLFFVVAALAVSGVGLRNAIRSSILLFRVYFWASLALVVLTVFLDRGLVLIWRGLTVNDVLVPIGVLLNAYIGTSLLAACMVYYQDRLKSMEKLRTRPQRVPGKK